jgi:pimeloyl-ACP methyl ester carboxylesterase
MFASQLTALPNSYTTVSFDRRGFGQTVTADEPFSHVDDLDAVIGSVEQSGVVLVGCSQGARIAIDYTIRNPAAVKALVLIGAGYSGAPESALDERTSALENEIEAAEESANLDELNRLEAHLWLDGPNSPEGRVSGALRELFLDMNAIALRAPELTGQREPPSAVDHLADIGCPVLLLEGALDASFVHEQHNQLESSIAGCKREVFSGCAHLPTLEQPAAFNDLLTRFLDQIA